MKGEYASRQTEETITSYSRAHRKYPMLLPWPILHGQRPPWEDAILSDETPIERVDEDAATAPEEGQLVFRDGTFYLNGFPAALEVHDGFVRARMNIGPILSLVAAGIAEAFMWDSASTACSITRCGSVTCCMSLVRW